MQGGAETQTTLERNREQFSRYEFVPNVLNDTSRRSSRTTPFGQDFKAPIGIAPMGGAALCAHCGDLALARASRRVGLPMISSGGSMTRLEEIKQEAPGAW